MGMRVCCSRKLTPLGFVGSPDEGVLKEAGLCTALVKDHGDTGPSLASTVLEHHSHWYRRVPNMPSLVLVGFGDWDFYVRLGTACVANPDTSWPKIEP